MSTIAALFRAVVGSGDKIGVLQKTEAAATVNVQRVALDFGDLTFPATPQLNAVSSVQNSADIDCAGKSTAVIRITYSANTTSAAFRIALKDGNGTAQYSYTAQITPANTAIVDGSRYQSEFIIIPTYGAAAFQIRLDSVPTGSGNISAYGVAV